LISGRGLLEQPAPVPRPVACDASEELAGSDQKEKRSIWKMKITLLLFTTVFLAVATAAENYKLTLFQPSYVGENQLQAGDYQLIVDDGHVIIKKGRKTVEADVKVESAGQKYKATTVRYDNTGGKYRISEIRLRGTSIKLVFD